MMKKLLFPTLVGLSMAFASCDTDPCKDLEGKCGSGTCFEGTCVCDEGYEADASGVCTVEWSAKFVGSYLGTEASVSANPDLNGNFTLTSPCTMTRSSESKVKIFNLGGFQSQIEVSAKRASSSDESATQLDFTDAVDGFGSKWTGTLTYNATTKKLTGTYTLVFTDGDNVTSTIDYTQQ